MIKSFKAFESKIVEPKSLSKNEFQDLVKNIHEIPKHEFVKLKKYFAQFGTNIGIHLVDDLGNALPRVSIDKGSEGKRCIVASVRGYYFSIYKLDDEWFLLRVYKPSNFIAVTDKWASKNYDKREYEGEIMRASWFYSKAKPGHEEMWIRRIEEFEEIFKCDQIDGLIDKIDDYLKLRTKKDPEIHFNKQKEKQYISDLKKKAMDKVRKMSKEDLENFINPK